MNISTVCFYIFSGLLLYSGFRVITAKNPVHAALFLVVAFVNASCLWIMLGAEFLALTLILVYVGAVMVLFLFVVMLLDVDVEALRKGFWRNFPLALILGLVMLGEMLLVLFKYPVLAVLANADPQTTISNSNKLGYILYTQYSLAVELASMILLLGLVVAVALTLRKSSKAAKYQKIAAQVAVKSNTRWQLVPMETSQEEPLSPGISTKVGGTYHD
jgi:NADH-quinone oxidoreductase subunit J